MVTYERWYSHNVCTNFSRIKPDRGTGFILMQLFNRGPLTRKEIFNGSKYGEYRPGFLSTCFTDMMEKGLIEVVNGSMYEYCINNYCTGKIKLAYRAHGAHGKPPIYDLTRAGRDLINRKSLEEVSECRD